MKQINDTLKILLFAAAVFAMAEPGLFFRDMRSARDSVELGDQIRLEC